MSRSRHTTKAPSQRQLRAGELIRHELAQILQREEVHDDSLFGLNVTVTEVQASPDLRNATVYVTTLGGQETDDAVRRLSVASAKIRRVLAPKLAMKFIPDLHFKRDASFDTADRIDQLLRQGR
ncbi:30S ribosome-binding factor RbfA [Parvularcula maris]|uniref:Ribosome-binding factor A n=1 Tax=Parvularcula maris TaxID=2965077 RepID=A0A9X2LAQ7_9PROT|nr:30S ribosome-binding factor RbfA [Parvularcula maris]MCQ8186250.1 30S ribosome-binding factor RbfA [Parvularcula maris]